MAAIHGQSMAGDVSTSVIKFLDFPFIPQTVGTIKVETRETNKCHSYTKL